MGIFSSIFGGIASSAAGGIVSAFTDPITKITETIADARVQLEKAKNDKERLAGEERVKTLEAKRDVLIAEAQSGIKLNALVRSLMAIPVVILLWKLIVFDKVFGHWLGWRTDPLSEDLWWIVVIIIGFYFVDSMTARLKR